MNKEKKYSYKKLDYLFKAAIKEDKRSDYLLSLTKGRTYNLCNLDGHEVEIMIEELSEKTKMITQAQANRLHEIYNTVNAVLFTKLSLKETVSIVSRGRVSRVAGLTFNEAAAIIDNDSAYCDRTVVTSKILGIGYHIGMLYGETETDREINTALLNNYLKKSGKVKKNIEDQTLVELRKTLEQFDKMKAAYDKQLQ